MLDTNHVKVVFIGVFTKNQRERILKRCDINLGRVVRLLKWLSVNNCFYSTLTFPEIDTLPLPQIEIVDESDEVDSENENVELTEDFKVVFPEGDMSEQNCGLESIELFMEVVDKVCESGKNMEIIL